MDWDTPIDITKNPDGTYTYKKKTLDKKPRWTLGTPRMLLASTLLILLLAWLHFGWILINSSVTAASIIILLGFIFTQLYLVRLSWEEF